MVKRDDEIKVLWDINLELQSGTHKVIEKLSQEKVSQQEALEKFKWKVVRDHESSILVGIGLRMIHHVLKVDWQDDLLHETEDFFVGLDHPIHVVVAQKNVHEEVAKEVIEMANDQAEALSSDKEVTDECLDDEHVEERRPSKRIKVTQEEMVKDKKAKERLIKTHLCYWYLVVDILLSFMM
ncbi:hypothetical protein Tco_1494896 [Tanacetum coccineum]